MTNQEILNSLKDQGFGVGRDNNYVIAYFKTRKVYKFEVEIALPEVPEEMFVQDGNQVIVYGIDS